MRRIKRFFDENRIGINLKARWTAKRFDIYKEQLDNNRPADTFLSGDYLASDGYLYYGHPLFTFFRSAQNRWYQIRNTINPNQKLNS